MAGNQRPTGPHMIRVHMIRVQDAPRHSGKDGVLSASPGAPGTIFPKPNPGIEDWGSAGNANMAGARQRFCPQGQSRNQALFGTYLVVWISVSQQASFCPVPAPLIDRWAGLLSRTTAFHCDFPRALVHSFDKPACDQLVPSPTRAAEQGPGAHCVFLGCFSVPWETSMTEESPQRSPVKQRLLLGGPDKSASVQHVTS